MNAVRTCFCLLVIFALVKVNYGGRYGGGSRGSSSRGSGSRIGSTSSSRVHHSSPPRPISHNPVTPRRQTYTSAPHYTTARPIPRYTTARSRPVQTTPYRQYTTPRANHETFGRVTSKPVYQPGHNSQPYRTTPRPRFTTPRSHSVGSPTRASGWVLPPRPAQQPHYSHGSTQHGYSQQSYPHTYTGYHGPSKVKIVNKYQYNYPGYYSLPVQSSYPGYYHAPSYYHYGSSDTGSTALGFFLGYGLGRLTTPTYSHYSFYDGYTPRYDHYTVHHYYHNRESIPPRQEIPSNTIIGCVGDSSTVCPSNTVSLCTSSGALMCVVTKTAVTPCDNNVPGDCVKTVIPCVNNTAPECKNAKQDNVTVSVPCISTAEVKGEVKYVDNTIIANIPENSTNTINGTINTNGTISVNGTIISNGTVITNDTISASPQYSTKYPITTTPTPQTVTESSVRRKRDAAQSFCVTVVALPAKKEETAGEKFLADAEDIASKFLESVWGL